MHYQSTKGQSKPVSLREAVLQGLPADNGLYLPVEISQFPESFLRKAPDLTFQQIAIEIAHTLLGGDLALNVLERIITTALTFDAPLVEVAPNTYSLELFHGPTLAFKDFGARFMARLMGYYMEDCSQELNILVATSGDTGSAVAHGFLGVPGIRVFILYPSGKVSPIQEQQLTTMGHNITALEIAGVFDDCQRLVKEAFLDRELSEKLLLSSANSINIARLIPQSFYYVYAYSRLGKSLGEGTLAPIFSVPSGNFGNLTAGVIAQRMGLPVERFIAATNINRVVCDYLNKGVFSPAPSKSTISNAMDVGNPSNFARLLALYQNQHKLMKQGLWGFSVTDSETRVVMKRLYESTGYIVDPHGAVAYLALENYRQQFNYQGPGIFLETAHPAKFAPLVEEILNIKIPLPQRLQTYLTRKKRSIPLPNDFASLKAFLLSRS